MPEYLKDKVVVVTGAGHGFGQRIVEKLSTRGSKVVGVDIDEAALEPVFRAIRDSGGQGTYHVGDVTDLAEMQAAVALATRNYGSVDVWVNNAGTMPLGYFAEHEHAIERWHRAIDINIKGVLNGICAVHDQMITQGRGHIVNISSIYANAGIEGSGVYSATKAAIGILSDALRIEAQGKIKVSTIKPTGVFGTNLHTSVVNPKAVLGLTGQRGPEYSARVSEFRRGALPDDLTDRDSVGFWLITPDDLTDAVVQVIDQPWGVNYSDLTVRASGEDYVY